MSERYSKTQPIRLVPLLCFKCRAPIPAQPDEVAWVCEQCGQGLLLDPSPAPGLSECATQALDMFFSKAVPAGAKGRPFWVSRGLVTFSERQTYKGDEGRAAKDFWAAPRLFFIPAWETSLDEILSMGVAMLRTSQKMETGSRVSFLPVVTLPGDMGSLAEFLVMSVEAERKDYLKTVKFAIKLENPQLWVLP